MARMIRKQIVIDAVREEQLAKLASELEMSQSEVIRLAIDALLRESEEEVRRRKAHSELMEMFREGLDLGLTDEHGNRTWKREDLYGGRGSR